MRLLNRDPDYGEFYYSINLKTRLVVSKRADGTAKYRVEFMGDHGSWVPVTATLSCLHDELRLTCERILRRELEESEQEAPVIAVRRRRKKGILQ